MLSSRHKLILKAIIEEYEKTGQPVGSRFLTEVPYLDFSSATLRYDMAELEEMEYLEKTHTSSGRIPSEKGYLFYLENLITRDHDVVNSFPLIDRVIEQSGLATERAIEEAIKLLSQLTSYTTLASSPKEKHHRIMKIDFIPINELSSIILIATDQGQVIHNNITFKENINQSEVSMVIKTLNDVLVNKTVEEARTILELEYAAREINNLMQYQKTLFESFINAFTKFANDNFYLSGISGAFAFKDEPDIENVRKMIDMFDRRDIAKIIFDEEGSSIRIGNDMVLKSMDDYTVLSIPYRIGRQLEGRIAVLGPKRMEYKKVIPLLEYIASHLGKLYKK